MAMKTRALATPQRPWLYPKAFTPYWFAVCGDLNTAARLGVLELTDRAQSQSPNLLDAF